MNGRSRKSTHGKNTGNLRILGIATAAVHLHHFRLGISVIKITYRKTRLTGKIINSQVLLLCLHSLEGNDSVGSRFATGWTSRGSNPEGCETFRTLPRRPWGPPSLLYNGYRVSYPGVKRPRHGVDHPPPLVARLKKE